jgi:hypothetical protein
MKAHYDPQNANRVIFQNTNYLFAGVAGIFGLMGVIGLILLPGIWRLGGLLFFFFGLLFLAFADFNRIVVDGDKRTLEIQHRTIFKQSAVTYPWDDFVRIGLETQSGDNGMLYRIAFFKKAGGTIPLNESFDNIDVDGKQRDVKILAELTRLPIHL